VLAACQTTAPTATSPTTAPAAKAAAGAASLTIGAVMTFVSLWFSPETKNLQLDEVGEKERAFEASQAAAVEVALAKAS